MGGVLGQADTVVTCVCPGSEVSTPLKMNGWNLEITHFPKENHLNQTFI